MNRHQFDKTECRKVSRQDLLAALRGMLLAPRSRVRSENREPSQAELEIRCRLDRKG